MFKCECCGLCCKNIMNIPELKSFDDGSGICINLDLNTNLCKIYSTRPIICRVDEAYSEYFINYITYDEYLDLNYKACKQLKSMSKR